MATVHFIMAAVLMASFELASGDCPPQRMVTKDRCSFHVHCHRTIANVKLPRHCQGSPNYPVKVEVTLTDAVDRYEDNLIEPEFLDAIVTLTVSGTMPETNLSFLEDMHGLENLYIVNDKIEQIVGKPFFDLERLEEVDLSHNRLTDVSELFEFESSPYRLKRLSLAHNEISELPNYALEELTSLVDLDLSNNRLSDLTEEPFANLTNLQFLRLNNNQIKDLNGAVNNLFKLRHLYLKGNQLQNIDAESLQIIYHLRVFDVSENDLDSLKPSVFMRHWLHFEGQQDSSCKILLSGNRIASLPNATSEEMIRRFTRHLPEKHEIAVSKNEVLPHVVVHTDLDLSKNEISKVEYNAFQTIVRLTTLDLSHNQLSDFVVNPKDLVDIKFLNLSCNSITILIFDGFSPMLNLQTLDLSHNQLQAIPERTFINNIQLKNLNMTFNSFTVLHQLNIRQFHPEGGILDLSNNALHNLHLPADEAYGLKTLVLSSNNIRDAAYIELSEQSDLKTLYMCNNNINKLSKHSLRLPVGLAHLDLGSNQIAKIEDGSFRRVAHLQTLRLAHNNLTKVNYGTFSGLRELKKLDLSNNQIHFLDSKVLSDSRFLVVLSLGFNEMDHLDYNGWLGHKFSLQVFLDGNNLTCDWLSRALRDYYNGYSRMRPSVLMQTTSSSTLDGIPCVSGEEMSQPLIDGRYGGTDERLLINSQKILEAVREQTYYLKKFLWQTLQNEHKEPKK